MAQHEDKIKKDDSKTTELQLTNTLVQLRKSIFQPHNLSLSITQLQL